MYRYAKTNENRPDAISSAKIPFCRIMFRFLMIALFLAAASAFMVQGPMPTHAVRAASPVAQFGTGNTDGNGNINIGCNTKCTCNNNGNRKRNTNGNTNGDNTTTITAHTHKQPHMQQ